VEGSEAYRPKNRTWTVEPLFSLEPVDDATAPFNLSLPQSATKTVRVLSTNSTSFTARVVGAAEDSRTKFTPVIRVLPGSVRPLSIPIETSASLRGSCESDIDSRDGGFAHRTGRRQCWR
jgi:hypothetical protein